MEQELPVSWHGHEWKLLPERALYWPAQAALLLADVHLGKVGHFRKHGIAIPGQVVTQDLRRIRKLCETYQPERLIFMGDLFHSTYNQEWELFAEEMQQVSGEKILVEGNHDRYVGAHAVAMGLTLCPQLELEGVMLLHEPPEASSPGQLTLCGHIHPGVRMQGYGRQRLRLPCFFFGPQTAVLPAFGQFTGLHTLAPTPLDRVYVVAEGQVISIPHS